MSSYWAGCSGQGLILDKKEFSKFLEAYEQIAGKNDKAVKQLGEYAEGDIGIEEVKFTKPGTDETFEFSVADDGCCEGFRLWPYRIDGKTNKKGHAADIPMVNIYFLNAERQLDGMNCFDEQPYPSYDAFVQEFKDKLSAYLPENFDWDAHIGLYSYACFA